MANSELPVIVASAALAVAVGVAIMLIGQLRRTKRLVRRIERMERRRPAELTPLIRAIGGRAAAAPGVPVGFAAEYGEDVVLWSLFGHERAGTCIEAGAFDGRTNSVTSVFEDAGWRALLVEPVAEQAAKAKLLRPGAAVVHGALGAPAAAGARGLRSLTIHRPTTAAEQLITFSETSEGHSKFVEELKRKGEQFVSETVPLYTLDELLGQHCFTSIDFAVIDVEGAEFSVLQGFTLARWKPRAILIEQLGGGDGAGIGGGGGGGEGSCHALLTAAGYERVLWVGMNALYLAPGEPELRTRLAQARLLAFSAVAS